MKLNKLTYIKSPSLFLEMDFYFSIFYLKIALQEGLGILVIKKNNK